MKKEERGVEIIEGDTGKRGRTESVHAVEGVALTRWPVSFRFLLPRFPPPTPIFPSQLYKIKVTRAIVDDTWEVSE